MSGTLTQRLENLSPAKRVLLEMKLKEKTLSPKDPLSISPRKNSGTASLSFNQESLLFMERLNPNSSTYNLYEAVRINGNLNFDALQKTIDAIAARHETLRTTFKEVEGKPFQIIAPPSSISIRSIDVSNSSDGTRENEAFKFLNQEIHRPMDVRRDSLFQVMVVKLAAQENFLLVKMHHIISDGWSMGVFWKEFSHLYQGFAQNTSPLLPKLPIQFGDYAVWVRQQLKKNESFQIDYWKNQLSNAPALLEIPTDRPRPAVQSFRGAQETDVLPAKLHSALKRFSQQENATLYMTLLAAFKVLMARYSGQEDLVIGSPIAGRNRTETENLIGFFVNTLALRSDVSGNPTFRQFLGQVKNTTLEAFSHQDLSFEKIVAAIKPERSLSYNPIFQVAFALQPDSESFLKIPGLELKPIKLGSVTSKFDIFLSAKETADGLKLTVEYSTDLFDKATISRLINHYRNLLQAIVANPNRKISEVSFLSETELDQLLLEWNNTTTEYPLDCIQTLFETQAGKNPDAIAVISPEGNLTYRELNEKANKIANYLRKKGVSPNSPVGIFMDRSPLMVAGILGILKAGGAYLPLDSSYPQSRLKFMLENAEVKVLLTVDEKLDQIPETAASEICLDSDWEIINKESAENPATANQVSDLAYIIFTSGSTGQPKGTLIPHKAVNRLVFNTNYVQFSASDNVAHVSNVSFDAATFELWGALLHGARLVILDKDLILSPTEFISELKARKISKMFLTTSLFNLLARDYPNAFASLQTLIVGGEALDPTAIRRVLENNPPERLVNGYGPTESTTFAVCHEIKSVAPEAQSVPIGRPISNTTAYVLDKNLNPVPVGVPGELFIGGDGLAQGYLNRPELNAERFITVSSNKLRTSGALFAVDTNQSIRLYRTGDIVRYLPDGSIEYIGRADNQIKLRGFRIELGEIESVLNTHPAIKEGVVAVKTQNCEKKIAAYYVPAENAALTTAEMREFLKQKLPEFMIPSVFVEVEDFALNPNGKVDRHKLPELKKILNDTEKSTELPHDELELKLTWIWQKVLGIQSVGLRDNFFELGGHSLIAVRLFSEIEKSLDCRLPLATLFTAPTIEQLAQLIRANDWHSTWKSLVPLRPNGTKPPFFCVHAVGGNVLEYNELANRLDSDQPFYALQALGLDGKTEPLDDVEKMAAAYLEEVRQIQPNGPYYLGGRSFGGTVAYEMARQLEEQGEEVALLAILDSYPMGWQKHCSAAEAEDYRKKFLKIRIQRHLENFRQLGVIGKVKYFCNKAQYKVFKYKGLFWRKVQKLDFRAEKSVTNVIRDIGTINYLAVKKYFPKQYSGIVTFYCAAEEVCPEENITGWQKLAQGGVEVVEVPGDHQTMIKDPQVQKLAEAICKSISLSGNA